METSNRKSEEMTPNIGAKRTEFLDELRFDRRLSETSLKVYEAELHLLEKLLKNGGLFELKNHLRKLAAATASRKLIIWKSFAKKFAEPLYEELQKWDQPRVQNKIPNFLTEEEIFRLENACLKTKNPYRNRLIIAFGVQLGLRLAESLNLKFKDIEGDWIKVKRKGGSFQLLPLSKSLQVQIKTYQDHRIALEDEYIFEGQGQAALTPRAVQIILKELGKKADIKKSLHPHCLRHSFATRMAVNGLSLPVLKEFLGHKQLATTERYLHVTPEHLREGLRHLSLKSSSS